MAGADLFSRKAQVRRKPFGFQELVTQRENNPKSGNRFSDKLCAKTKN